MSILLLYPNPYAHLDHNGLLAGLCPVAEEVRPGEVMPTRTFISGRLEHVGAENRDPHAEGEVGMPVGAKHHYEARFSSDPTPVSAPPGAMASFYACRLGGSAECFRAEADGGPPLLAMANARLDAITRWKLSYGTEPPTAKWAKQFELDDVVAKISEVVQVQRDAAWDAAKKDTTKAGQDAEQAEKTAHEAQRKLWQAAAERALESLKPKPPAKPKTPPVKEG